MRLITLTFLCCVFLMSGSAINAQTAYKETFQKNLFWGKKYPQKLPVLFRPYAVADADSQFTVYLVTEIKHNFFQFLYQDGIYSAASEVEVIISRRKGGKVKSQIWQTELSVDNFRSANSRHLFHTTIDTVRLPAGQYQVLVKYHDLNGQQRLSFQRQMTIRSEEGFYSAGPLFFYPSEAGQPNTRLPINGTPSPIQGYWDFNQDLGILLNIKRNDPAIELPVAVELRDAESDELFFEISDTLKGEHAQQSLDFVIPGAGLNEGKYRLTVNYGEGEERIRRAVPFHIVWFEKPLSLWDPDLSIKPLQHILEADAFKKLDKGKVKEKLEKLDVFWGEIDPTPETAYNELKQEFYNRVDSAIVRFSNKRELGWSTDPGVVYISQGPPDRIEDHSLAPVPDPFMIWTYIKDGKEYSYVFRALDGRKQYKLAETRESSL